MSSPSGPTTTTSPASSTRDAALAVLRELTGNPEAGFRDGQAEAIEALVDERRRVLVVERTGWGKSAVYFVSAKLLRAAGGGPALIVSPLIALMRDQVAAAERAGVRAVAISSANATEWGAIEQRLDSDDVDVLLVSPERLVNPRFRATQLPRLMERCSLLVIDEAHCISDWGHDFRPDYRRLRDLVAELPDSVPVLATTATANARVVTDVVEQLGSSIASEVLVIRGPLARASLRLGVLNLQGAKARLGWLVQHLGELQGSGIVYCLTVSAAEDTARLLAEAGYAVQAYTGRTDPDARLEAERALLENRVKALVATSALGMGFDKPDLGFVVHLGAPSSPVAYYQQVGRAGRATESADVLLLPGSEDEDIWRYFATASMPSEESAGQVLGALAEADGPLAIGALEARVDLKRTPLELLLKVLAVDGAAEFVPGGWRATGRPWTYDAERYARVAAAREAEQKQMLAYEELTTCRMEFLAKQLDDETAAPCGRCDNCAGRWFDDSVEEQATGAAGEALQRVGVPIAPRGQWPQGMDTLRVRDGGKPLKGRIAVGDRYEEGRALARLTDLGWGGPLRELFANDENGEPIDSEVPAALGNACVQVLATWGWETRPAAVVSVPSLSRPRLVSSLAIGLSQVGRLPYLGSLDFTPDPQRLRAGGNSAYRLASVWGRFEVSADLAAQLADAQGAPILLVDDLVDSRWTLTVAALRLRRAGAGPVLPFALASVG